MGELTLLSDYGLDTTMLSNIYIDEYMKGNNEAQIKIYLYLLRKLSSRTPVSVPLIADFFNYTVLDVERSLIYMQKQGLMKLDISDDDRIVGIRILPLAKKEVVMLKSKPEYSKDEILEFAKLPEIKDLIFAAEQYLGKMITQDDVKNIFYMNRTLGFSEDLIDYLIGYCISIKKKSFGYMSKVAKEWSDAGVTTIKDAKKLISDCPKEVYEVFNCFGIKGGSRKPSASEIKFVNLWIKEYGFSMGIIEKACIRTVEKTHSVSFEYADAILKDWKEKGVKNTADIDRLDEEFLNKKLVKETAKATAAKKPSANNKFTGYSQREYDFDELEKRLLSK